MTYEEMKAQAEAAAKNIADTHRGLLMWQTELMTLLVDAYCQGFKAGVDKSVAEFAPHAASEYERLTGRITS